MEQAIIDIRNMYKIYNPGENEVRALDGVSLAVYKGEFVAIVGHSGSGKSTLMNMIGCLDTPTSGTYFLNGQDVSALSDNALSAIRNEQIGFIFQSFNLIKNLNALENVELPLIYRGLPAGKRRLLALEALERVGLASRMDHRPNQMSGGQQQRVAVARAIAAHPPLILADEPTGNLDTRAGAKVFEIIRALHAEGNTIVLITHDEGLARKAQRIVRITDGKIDDGELALAGNAVLSALRGPLPTYVQTQTAAAGDISQSLSTTGTLTSGQTVVVPSPVTAPLAEVKVEAGQIVNAGDLLATFDTEPLERAYRQASAAYESGQLQKSDALTASDSAQARFNDAAANLNNLAVQKDKASAAVNSLTAQYEALADKQSEEALSVKAALDAAAADLANQQQALSAAKATYDAEKQAVLSDSAKRQLELAQVPSSLSVQSAKEDLARGRDGVTAPISGVVTSLSAVPGSSAAAYGPLCTIQSLSDVYVDVALSRYDLEKVKPGQSAVVTTLGRTYTGTVASIDAMATAGASATGTATAYVHAKVQLDAPDGDIKLGLEANVVIATGEAKGVLSLPISAVNTDVSGQFCYVVENGAAVRRDVKTGLSSDTQVEIASGISAGDEVILNPQDVTEGMAVSSDPAAAAQMPADAGMGAVMMG